MHMRGNKSVSILLIALALVFQAPQILEAEPIRVGVTGVGIEFTPFHAGRQKGLFKKYGLDAEVISVSGASLVVQILAGGSIDFAIAGQAAVRAAAQGADMVMIASYINHFPWAIIVKPEIRKVADIKGKKIGISRFGSASEVAVRVTMEHLGVNPDKDIAMIQAGGQTERFAALKAGFVDATVVGPPLSGLGDKLGFNTYFKMADLGISYPHEGIVVSRKYAAAHGETIMNFLKAFLESVHAMKTDKAFALSAIAGHLRLDPVKDRDALEATYREAVLGDYEKNPRASADGVKFVLDSLKKEKNFVFKGSQNPRDYVDTSFMDRLNQSGFVDNLYDK